MPLVISKARKQLLDPEVESAKLAHEEDGDFVDYDQAFRDSEAERAATSNIRKMQEELEDRLSSELPAKKDRRDSNRRKRYVSKSASVIDELGLALDALLSDVIDHDVRAITNPLHLTVIKVLEAGLTTTYAITLLIKNGYVVDADARWRGLYELTCQAAVLSMASKPEEAALRYLMHGKENVASRLKEKDLLRGKQIIQQELSRGLNRFGNPIWEDSYQWIPLELLGGTPQQSISQRKLFQLADLQAAPMDLVEDSHKSVHMSSLVVAPESMIALDNDPGGYEAGLEEEIAERTALTLYELVAHCCVLAENLSTGTSYPAWEQEFHKRVQLALEELS